MKKKIKIVRKVLMILLGVFLLLLPTGFKMIFKFPTLFEFFSYEQQVKNSIEIYISIISAIGTILLGYAAYRQTKVANMQNERLIRLEETSKKAYVKLNIKESYFTKKKNEYDCCILVDNISDVSIIKVEYESAGKIDKKSNLKIATKRGDVPCDPKIMDNKIKLEFLDSFIEEEKFIFCFKLVLTGIYGYKTVQVFNIKVNDGMICDVQMREETGEAIRNI